MVGTLVTALLLIAVTSAHAFDGKRKGFVFGLGGGMAPLASVKSGAVLSEPLVDDSDMGLAYDFVMGYGFSESDWLVWGINALSRDSQAWDVRLGQRFNGVSWYHAFGARGSAWVTSIGAGRYVVDPPNEINICISFNGPPCPPTAPSLIGIGWLVGAGRQLAPRWSLMAYASGGRADGGVVIALGERQERKYNLFHLSVLAEYIWD